MSENDPPRTEFDRRYKAGHWAARIDTQDKVATIVAVEALGGSLELVPYPIANLGGRIAFEAREDFELRWGGGRQYVSVKDKQVSRSDLYKAISSLESVMADAGDVGRQSFRVEAASLASEARTLYEDIVRLRSIRSTGSDEDYGLVAAEFVREHKIDADLAQLLVVSERRIGDNRKLSNAIFAHAMRDAVRVHNYSDKDLTALFEDLVNSVFYDRRKVRGVLDLGDFERLILAPLMPLQMAAYQAEYVRTRYGYVKDNTRQRQLQQEQELVLKCMRSLMKEWRQKTKRDRRLDQLRGHIGCLSCDHPMIANFNGRNGLACPACGYQPFMTLFYACDCGAGVVIQRQPEISSLEMFRDAVRLVRDENLRCAKCNERPLEEKFTGRIFTLPIPYPILRYPIRELLEWRVKLGWTAHGRFESGDEQLAPDEALIATTDDEPEDYTGNEDTD